MDQERFDRMRRAMQRERIDAIVVRLPENVLLLGGFWPMLGATYIVFPIDGAPHAIIPSCYEEEERCPLLQAKVEHYSYGLLDSEAPAAEVGSILAGIAKANSWKRIGFEDRFESAAPSWNSAEFLYRASTTGNCSVRPFRMLNWWMSRR
jgi:Xaa-Pro dipeptidase